MFDLRSFRNDLSLSQTEMAQLLGCTQPNITRMERDYKDLSKEQARILSDKYGENTVHKYIITDESLPIRKPRPKNNQQEQVSDSDLSMLLIEQQKSISDLINMVKSLQAENSKLTDALIRQKLG